MHTDMSYVMWLYYVKHNEIRSLLQPNSLIDNYVWQGCVFSPETIKNRNKFFFSILFNNSSSAT